jgi:hypothetical protein
MKILKGACPCCHTRDVNDVRKAVAFSVPLGNNLFKEQIEATSGKSVGYIT